MVAGAHLRFCMPVAVLILGFQPAPARADMIDMTGVEPQHICADCHGLDGAGNRIKFPRLAGQNPKYLAKQLRDFQLGHRKNDGGQMQQTATEAEEKDIPKIVEWFSGQEAPWPAPTMEGEFDLARAEKLVTVGAGGVRACTSCHSASAPYLADQPVEAPRLAGQYDYYIAKQLRDFRDGRRGNDPDGMMSAIARRLTDADIASLAVFLSQNPALHEVKP
jgi:cytochrome c553